ncbi:hypothetical protein [Rhizobium leguminosarum]|jgi:hypothetical protein|uniref:hypothetical protein n=1 Tax=Rhizobium leguminosarum TaxID=384 RepID=UPI00103186F1|nr:hypothetical protein [Rhizobium leguminosarum]TAU87489.1 hypothetical protein ELI41_02265 [Rhizobium leguminosarum]TAV52021.1 hypothetical protein ELI29_02260 [Rhizobium leguminosarum]
MTRSVSIVASTLPIAFLAARAEALGVDRIVATSANLNRSYGYLARKIGREMEIETTPPGFVRQSLYFALLVAKCRFLGRRLVIFHECCMPVLDLLILLLRPKGDHFPQVSMLGSIPMDISAAPKSKLLTLLRLCRLDRLFVLYYSPPVGDNPGEYSLSVKAYPRSIVSHPVGYAGEASSAIEAEDLAPRSHTILLLTGKALSPDEDQITVFSGIVESAAKYGLRCDVKDHPNPYFRLGFASEAARSIDPEMPSELLDDDYALVIGASSTGLLRYGNRAFSIIEMLPSLSADETGLAKKHFDMAAPGHTLRYLESLQQLESILEELSL